MPVSFVSIACSHLQTFGSEDAVSTLGIALNFVADWSLKLAQMDVS